MIIFLVQLAVVVGLSIGAWHVVGATIYLGMTALTFFVALGLIYANERRYRASTTSEGGLFIGEPERSAIGFLSLFFVALFAALLWIALPVIVARGRLNARGRVASSAPSASDPH